MLLCEVNVQGDSSDMPAPRGCPVVMTKLLRAPRWGDVRFSSPHLLEQHSIYHPCPVEMQDGHLHRRIHTRL